MRVAFVFPGQGSQEVGMGRALCETYPVARDVFAQADRALGESLSTVCFEGPLEALTLTANTQPAILTASIAAFRTLESLLLEKGHTLSMHVAAGHSLGEYSALVSVGALSFEQAVRLVRTRGLAMQQAVAQGEGAMAAVMGLDAETLTSLCSSISSEMQGRVLSPANFNSPGQIVVAGHADAVERLGQRASDHRARLIPLKVSAPFHCALMEPAARELAGALANVAVQPFRCPVVSNIDASPYNTEAVLRDVLVRQVSGSVKWEQSVRRMIADGVETFVEVGPGKVLAGLIRRIDKSVPVHSVMEPASLESVLSVLGA